MTAETDLAALEAEFDRRMMQVYLDAKRELGYNATGFLQMVGEHGGLATARALLRERAVSEGFVTLWAANRADLTVESVALQPRWAPLFTDEERATARERLGKKAPP